MAAASGRSPHWRLAWLLATVVAASFPAQNALSASANVSPSSGAAGRQVTLSSSGFDEDGIGYNTGFYAVIGNGFLGACPLSSPANCAIQVNLPASFPGAFEIQARNSAGETGTATYTIVPAQFSISPACGPAGTTVTAHGKFFAVNFDAGLKFDGSYVATNNYPDADGTFSRSFVVPAAAAGNYPVLAQNSAGNSEFQEFRIPCQVVGEITELTGPMKRCIANCSAPNPADRTLEDVHLGDPIHQDDLFEMGDKARANLKFQDNTEIVLRGNTKFHTADYFYDDNTPTANTQRYQIFNGAFSYLSGVMGKQNNRDHIVETPAGSIGIRGTWFVTRVDELAAHTEVYLSHGEIAVTPDGTGLSSVFNGPVTVVFDANGVTSSAFVDTEADGVADPVDNCPAVANADQADSDGDTVGNACDNCTLVVNTLAGDVPGTAPPVAKAQLDSDDDGFGNRCDGDLNNTGAASNVNTTDYTILRSVINKAYTFSANAAGADLNGDGTVNTTDYTIFRSLINKVPGPSGLACAGTIPCP